MAAVEEIMLVRVDTRENSNKFYQLTLNEDGTLRAKYGRVGANGATVDYDGGRVTFDRLLRDKQKKGYEKVDIVASNTATKLTGQENLSEIAKKVLVSSQHQGNTEIETLIDRLVSMNKHEILTNSGGLIQIDASGQITTPLGILKSASLQQARGVLSQIATKRATDDSRNTLIEQYLKLVPQKVPAKRGWQDDYLVEKADIVAQTTFLTQLQDSVSWYEQAKQKAITAAATDEGSTDIATQYANLFRMQIAPLDSKSREFRKIEQFYTGTKNAQHSASRLRLKRVYQLTDHVAEAEYASVLKEIGNEKQLWHGTRVFNVLSIMRKGLFVPPTSGSSVQITGRMFGDGVYMSDQSTKSLNYSYGYWGGGTRDSSCFMFLADVAMGHEFRPAYWDSRSQNKARNEVGPSGKRYNSINVKGGTCNVRNNEMIVWDSRQIRLKYLCQFED